ncbi:calcium channel, voltage-dependent, N type, alpha 1B subunit, a isoform X1 [Tachysurus ichikawai]
MLIVSYDTNELTVGKVYAALMIFDYYKQNRAKKLQMQQQQFKDQPGPQNNVGALLEPILCPMQEKSRSMMDCPSDILHPISLSSATLNNGHTL